MKDENDPFLSFKIVDPLLFMHSFLWTLKMVQMEKTRGKERLSNLPRSQSGKWGLNPGILIPELIYKITPFRS